MADFATLKILLIINADTSSRLQPPLDRTRERLADFAALKMRLQADVLHWQDIEAQVWSRLLSKIGGKGLALAVLAFARRQRYDVFYCDSENNGLILAILFKLSQFHRPLLMIGHRITPFKKAVLFKWMRLHSHISRLFLHSSAQYNKAVKQLGIPAKRVQLLPYQVDTEFWKIENAQLNQAARPYICTAGLEFRDYPTLIEAVRGLEIDLKIGAASFWSKRKNSSLQGALPPNVEARSYSYTELRDLYANSCFVVVPLYNVDFQAGITLILEAMAMSKAVILTQTDGQCDTIVDRRGVSRSIGMGLFTKDDFGQTGYYVPPGNVAQLRQAIQYLLDHPDEAHKLGQQARRTVESLMNVEHFAERISQAILEVVKEQ